MVLADRGNLRESDQSTEFAADGSRSQSATQIWPGRVGDSPPSVEANRANSSRARLPGAIWPGQREAPQYRGAARRQSAHAGIAHKKMRLPFGGNRNRAASRRERLAVPQPGFGE